MEAAVVFSLSQRPVYELDDGGEGGTWAALTLRQAAVVESDSVLRQLPSASESVYRWAVEGGGIDGRDASAGLDEPAQRCLQHGVDLGEPEPEKAGGAGHGTDVWRPSGGTGHGGARESTAAAFADEPTPFSLSNVTKAIALFQQTLLSGDSPYDEYRRGDDPNAISESAKRSYPEANLGLFEFARREEDIGKFKAPTLRNIAPTALYMHDGSVKTLEEAIDHYKAAAPGKAAAPVKHMLRGEVAAVYAADPFRIGTDPFD